MKVCYIIEKQETCDFIKRLIIKIKRIFNIIESQEIEERLIYNLPIFKNTRLNKYRINRLCKKIQMKLNNEGITNIVLSKNLEINELLKQKLYCEKFNILNGRYLFKCLIYEIIDYIIKRKNKNVETAEISMLIDDFNDINKELIIDIAKRIRTLNIITNHMDGCKTIEKYLYDEFGIILNVSNNKRTSLSSSEIIINIDFTADEINQYVIYNNAIIVNILDKIHIQSKKFSGININYYKIDIPKRCKIEGFKNEEIYESIIYKKDLYQIRDIILKDKIKIRRLIGNNGYIKDGEFNYK